MPQNVNEIASALEREQFVPYFQPLVEIRTGQIEGFEVLARWVHPVLGVITPDDFIPVVSEKRGLINALTVSLLRKTFAAARQIPSHIGFSVNVAPAQFHDLSLPSLIACMASEACFDLHRLTIELTESALLGDLKLAGEVAAGLKALGIRLALDDFGTGYSSLLHLQALPFDEIKVDSSFVRTMVQLRQSRKITSAVLGLGQSLGLRTVAEGVEESSQAELLIWQGCNLAQGWLYERPVPAEGLGELLARRLPVVDPAGAAFSHGCEAAHTFDTPSDRVSQLRAIYDVAPVGLVYLDRDLRYVSLNQRAAEFIGASVKAHLGRKVADVAPGIYAQVESYMHRTLKGEAFQNVEIHAHPSERNTSSDSLMLSFQPAQDEAGEIIGVSISMVDISAVKQKDRTLLQYEKQTQLTVEKLRESEAQLRATLQSMPVGIVLAEAPSGKVSFANAQAISIFGKALRPGVQWADIARRITNNTGDALEPDDMPLLRAIRSGETVEAMQVHFRRGRANGVWLSISGAPVRAEDGEVIGGVVAIQILEKPKRNRLKILSRAHKFATSFAQSASPAASAAPHPQKAIPRKAVASVPRFARRGAA